MIRIRDLPSILLAISIIFSSLLASPASLSTSNLLSLHRAFADDCYDSEDNYNCEDMSEGSSNSDSGNSDSSGDEASKADSSSESDANSDSSEGYTTTGYSSNEDSASDSNNGDTGTGNSGITDIPGDSDTADSSNGGVGDTNCNDEEGSFVCTTPMPDTISSNNLGIKDDKSSGKSNDNNGTDNRQGDQILSLGKCDNNTGCDNSCQDNNGVCDGGEPTADAGPDRQIREGDSVTIDGSHSNDPYGDNLQYHWNVNDAGLIIGNQESEKLDIKAPEVQSDSYYRVTLTVTDKDGHSDSDHMSLKVIDTDGESSGSPQYYEIGNMSNPAPPAVSKLAVEKYAGCH